MSAIAPQELRRITDTLRAYAAATGKDIEQALNRFMRNVSIYASAKTRKADASEIERELRRVIGHRISGASGRRLKKPKPIHAPTTVARAIVVKRMREAGEELSNEEIRKRADALVRGRIRSVGYHRAGYIPALREFGAPTSRAGAKQFGPPKGTASKATQSKLTAKLRNFARDVSIQAEPLQAAAREARIDMETYVKALLEKRAQATNRKL